MDSHKYTFVWLVSIAVVGVVVMVALAIATDPVVLFGEDEDATTLSFPTLWILSVIAYTVFSWRFWDPVPIDKSAALTFFGKPIADVGAGAPFAPLFFIKVATVTALVIQKEFPADPQHIFRGEMKDQSSLPEGMRPPIRIQFRDSIDQGKMNDLFTEDERIAKIEYDGEVQESISFQVEAPRDGLARRVTAEPYPVVRFIVESPALFLRNIGSVEKALEQIEDEMFSVLTRFYPRMSVGQALQNIRWMNVHLYKAVAKRVGVRGGTKSWGIRLQDAYVKYIYTSHGVNTAISEAAQAPFIKEKVITESEGAKVRLINEGEGKAKASRELEKQTLEGRTLGLKKMAKQLEISGSEALSAEVGRSVAEGGNAIIVGAEGVSQVAAMGAAFSKGQQAQPKGGES